MRQALAGAALAAALALTLPGGARGTLVSPDSLVALAEARVRAAVGALPEGGALECRALFAPEAVDLAGSDAIAAHLSDPRAGALMTPVLRVLRGDRVIRSIPIPFRLQMTGPRLRATRPLLKGEPLAAEAVVAAVEEIPIPWDDPLTDASQAQGLVLRRAVGAGEIVRSDLLELPVLVHSGDPVLLALESSAVRILARGTARGNGRLGDRVTVVRDGDRRRITAVVVAPGRVAVRLNSLTDVSLRGSQPNDSPEIEGASR